jgi:hypothetical protein
MVVFDLNSTQMTNKSLMRSCQAFEFHLLQRAFQDRRNISDGIPTVLQAAASAASVARTSPSYFLKFS